MRALNRLLTRILNFVTNRRGDERLREEIGAHVAIQTEENILAGMTLEEAHRLACVKFGGVEAVREDYRAELSLPFIEDLIRDICYALRGLRRSPAFTAVVILTLMLGIGANVVVFGVLNAVLLQPLTVNNPQNLYQIRPQPWMIGRLLTTSYPAFEDFQRQNTTFSDMAAVYAYSDVALGWKNNALREVHGDEVTGNYFDLLGVRTRIGRLFHTSDIHGQNSAPYVVLSDNLWRKEFNADQGVIGKTVALNRQPFTVIGVTSPQFHGTERFVWPDYWIPAANETQVDGHDFLHDRTSQVTVIGRLKPGVTPQQASENLNAIAAVLAKEYPATDKGLPMRLIHPGLLGDDGDLIRAFLYSVTVLALLVLAAACANLASLFAARASDRGKELALRVALGASRRRLVRQLLTEAVVVSLIGGAAGLLGADLLLGTLNRSLLPYGHLAAVIDTRVCLTCLALSLGVALLFGIVPAQQAWQSNPLQMIKSGPVDSAHLRRFALRDLLLGTQIAICTLLVAASLVAARGMVRTLHAPLGMQPQGTMLAEVRLYQVGDTGDAALQKEKAMIEAARSMPGVTAVGAVDPAPMVSWRRGIPIYQPGTIEFTPKNYALASYAYLISPGYLEAAGTRLRAGRDVSWEDTPKTPFVAIVNETFARKLWGSKPAIGQYFIVWGKLTEVVGVVENGKYHDLAESPEPAVFLPLPQHEDSGVVLVVRSRRAPSDMAGALQWTLRGIEPNMPIAAQSWPDALGPVLFSGWAATVALGIMGLLAEMLALTGIFGMAAYSVSRRMKELGIRSALGARRTQLMSAAVGRPIALLGMGSAVGLLAGVFSNQLLRHIVYQANPNDPAVLAGAVLAMALIGIAGSAIPAQRALAIDPARLMREE